MVTKVAQFIPNSELPLVQIVYERSLSPSSEDATFIIHLKEIYNIHIKNSKSVYISSTSAAALRLPRRRNPPLSSW